MRMESSNRVERAAPYPVKVSVISSCTSLAISILVRVFGKAKCLEMGFGTGVPFGNA